MAGIFLEEDEITLLTHRSQHTAQVRALRFMGIEHKVRADGSVAVLRSHIENIFGGTPASEAKKPKVTTPDWSVI